jgi:hypothetical protein
LWGLTLEGVAALGGLAAWREKNNAATTTARSKSRSPTHPNRSRRAAEPQSAHLKRDRRGLPDRRRWSGTPASASRRASATPQTSLRLCASAREKQRRDDHHPLKEPIADTPEQVAQSRRAAERSPQARSSGTSRPSAPEQDAQLCVTASVGDTPDLSAALRLCARKTTPRRPPPARRADRRHTRTGRAEPQSRRALTSSAIVGDIQTVGAGAGRPVDKDGAPCSPTSPSVDAGASQARREKLRRLLTPDAEPDDTSAVLRRPLMSTEYTHIPRPGPGGA